MELDRLKQRLEGLEDTTLRRFNWRAVCNESCKHGSEGGQGYSESFFRNHLPDPTISARSQNLPKQTNTSLD